jgi:hypothetical protein
LAQAASQLVSQDEEASLFERPCMLSFGKRGSKIAYQRAALGKYRRSIGMLLDTTSYMRHLYDGIRAHYTQNSVDCLVCKQFYAIFILN